MTKDENMSLTPINRYCGVDIFEDEHSAHIIIVDGKREQFNTQGRVFVHIFRALKGHTHIARAGQLVSK